MPITAAERRSVQARVAQLLLDEIHGEFLDLYATAVSITEKHPEQVNNELRNALTHLSRAVAVDTLDAALSELSKATAHIERAKRDAVKIAVIALRDMIASAYGDIKMLNGAVDPAFTIRRDAIADSRKALLKKEAMGESVLNGFIELFLLADALHTDLLTVLGQVGRRRGRWHYRWYAARRYLLGALGGIVIFVLGRMILAAIVPDPIAFSNGLRERVGMPAQAAASNVHSASSSSTAAKPGDAAPR